MNLQEVIDKINQLDDPNKRKLPLPNDSLIKQYEEKIGIPFSDEYKMFLKSVSNAFIGFMSPYTLSQKPSEYTNDLLAGIKEARKVGIPHDWIPICEDNGDYYCLTLNGKVRYWSHNGISNEEWPSLAVWANEVWLNGC